MIEMTTLYPVDPSDPMLDLDLKEAIEKRAKGDQVSRVQNAAMEAREKLGATESGLKSLEKEGQVSMYHAHHHGHHHHHHHHPHTYHSHPAPSICCCVIL